MTAFALALCLLAQDLPAAPEGVRLREVVKLGDADGQPVRVQAHPSGALYVLYSNGDLWEVDVAKGAKRKCLEGRAYFRPDASKFVQALGLYIDPSGRAYVVTNERHDQEKPQRAHVAVYRFASAPYEKAVEWFGYDHPWGIGPFNHGACRLATGPDGLIYLGVGSRTDHGEPGKSDALDKKGETPMTACILRLDPKAEKPVAEVFARGLRNPFGFDWDDQGRLVAGEHGPDADHSEELNWIRQGKHYGFPYRFGNQALPMYPDAVKAPEGLEFEKPIANLGPDARPGSEPEYTFHPHSAPTGMLFYRKGSLPARYDGSFFLTRFGNFLGKTPVGFDLVQIRLVEKEGGLAAEIRTFVDKLRRPIDVCQHDGKLYILEHTSYDASRPSRLIEAAGAP